MSIAALLPKCHLFFFLPIRILLLYFYQSFALLRDTACSPKKSPVISGRELQLGATVTRTNSLGFRVIASAIPTNVQHESSVNVVDHSYNTFPTQESQGGPKQKRTPRTKSPTNNSTRLSIASQKCIYEDAELRFFIFCFSIPLIVFALLFSLPPIYGGP